MYLWDARFINFSSLLLEISQSNLANRYLYFDFYPNFIVLLIDPNITKTYEKLI
jgi:hypothetical protein